MTTSRRLNVATVLIVSIGSATAARADDARTPERQGKLIAVKLKSAYLSEPIGRIRVVTIAGTLGEKGRVVLDRNNCSLNEFGDPETCTLIGFNPIEVQFKRLDVKDATGKNRSVYRIVGDLKPDGAKYTLIVPEERHGVYRLVVDVDGEKRRVVTLEPMPVRREEGEDDPADARRETVRTILDAKLSVPRNAPGRIEIEATGEVPTAGWRNAKLERTVYKRPPKDGVQDYTLTAVRPNGPAATVISKVTAVDVWKQTPNWLKGFRVHGVGDGVKEVKFVRAR